MKIASIFNNFIDLQKRINRTRQNIKAVQTYLHHKINVLPLYRAETKFSCIRRCLLSAPSCMYFHTGNGEFFCTYTHLQKFSYTQIHGVCMRDIRGRFLEAFPHYYPNFYYSVRTIITARILWEQTLKCFPSFIRSAASVV